VRHLAILGGSLLLAACSSPARDVLSLPTAPTSTVPMGSDFTLAPGESVVVNASGLTITFLRVSSESRCPTDALILCAWEGSATAAMTARNGAGVREFALETYAPRSQATLDGLVVKLLGVTPAPRTLDSIPPASYRATLRISRP
jgi:hypothetical protein